MRFVPIKDGEQQAVLSLHRARQGFVKARTAQANQIRGLLAEYGIAIPKGIGYIAKRLPEILEDGDNGLPDAFRQLIERLGTHLKELDRQVDELEAQIRIWHHENEASRKLEKIPGIGPITASALVASIGDAMHLEYIFCQINAYGSSVHGGRPFCFVDYTNAHFGTFDAV